MMSVCALLVAGALAGVVGTTLEPGPGSDLERVLADLQDIVSAIGAREMECTVAWTVPPMPSGAMVEMSFAAASVSARAEGTVRAAETWPALHTWVWDGFPLNGTRVQELDLAGTLFSARTGDSIVLSSRLVLLDDSEQLLLFVS